MKIGKYEVEKILGRGGMGTVYQALDPVLHRRVAVKMMIPGLADAPDLRARFLREAQAAGGLRHRNIVTVYDLGEDKGQPYIAMEYIEGTDLEKIIQHKEPYSIEWKLDVIRQVCDGLGHAHKSGIIHRDVKPANIRVTADGEVKIMDFGIAHLQSSTMTKSGLVLGTVHYMAPEQVEGHRVDHRADMFSVGAIAYELLAYRRPWDGDNLTAVMYKITHEAPNLDGLPKTDYSPGLEAIIGRALAKSPDGRYAVLEEMRDDLERLVRETAGRLAQRGGAPAGSPEAQGASLVEEARRALENGDTDRATTLARQALGLLPADAAARSALRDAEAEALRRRVEREIAEIRAEMERARSEGHLQKAVSLCRRLLELDPDDEDLKRTAGEVQSAIQDKEVEQLAGMALSYATDGDLELAQKIAAKIGRIAPESARYLQLNTYLEEETARRTADALTSTAQEHLALGNLEEAKAAAEEALAARADHALAREIVDRAAHVIAMRDRPRELSAAVPVKATASALQTPLPEEAPEPVRLPAVIAAPREAKPAAPPHAPAAITSAPLAASSPTPAVVASPTPTATPTPTSTSTSTPAATPTPIPAAPTPIPIATSTAAPAALTPLPEPPPAHPEAAALLDAARRYLKERAPQKAVTALEQAAALDPAHPTIQRLLETSRVDARRTEVAALTSAALNHFMQNNHAKARTAVDKALALEPENKRARELLTILGSLT